MIALVDILISCSGLRVSQPSSIQKTDATYFKVIPLRNVLSYNFAGVLAAKLSSSSLKVRIRACSGMLRALISTTSLSAAFSKFLSPWGFVNIRGGSGIQGIDIGSIEQIARVPAFSGLDSLILSSAKCSVSAFFKLAGVAIYSIGSTSYSLTIGRDLRPFKFNIDELFSSVSGVKLSSSNIDTRFSKNLIRMGIISVIGGSGLTQSKIGAVLRPILPLPASHKTLATSSNLLFSSLFGNYTSSDAFQFWS